MHRTIAKESRRLRTNRHAVNSAPLLDCSLGFLDESGEAGSVLHQGGEGGQKLALLGVRPLTRASLGHIVDYQQECAELLAFFDGQEATFEEAIAEDEQPRELIETDFAWQDVVAQGTEPQLEQ